MPDEDDRIEAMPTKAFFVNMLVRDIPLERAVLDLLDNCIDGAKSVRPGDEADYTGLFVTIEMNGERFKIEDNCGGFDVRQARRYAFRFGRPDDADSTAYSIGQFGVGMKRALFKFGKFFEVKSTTENQHWSMHVGVDEWLSRETIGHFCSMRSMVIRNSQKRSEGRRLKCGTCGRKCLLGSTQSFSSENLRI